MPTEVYIKDGLEFKKVPNYMGFSSTNDTIVIKEIRKFKWCENVLNNNVCDARSGWIGPESCANKCDAFGTDICRHTNKLNTRHISALDENGIPIVWCQRGNINYDRGCYKEIKSLSK